MGKEFPNIVWYNEGFQIIRNWLIGTLFMLVPTNVCESKKKRYKITKNQNPSIKGILVSGMRYRIKWALRNPFYFWKRAFRIMTVPLVKICMMYRCQALLLLLLPLLPPFSSLSMANGLSQEHYIVHLASMSCDPIICWSPRQTESLKTTIPSEETSEDSTTGKESVSPKHLFPMESMKKKQVS